MKDHFSSRNSARGDGVGLKLAPLTIEVPVQQDVSLALVNRLLRQPRRKRRTRPATERFHDLYESTGEVLGEGSHGAVHAYLHKQSRQEYAVKIINKSFDYNRSKILKEIDIFYHCQGHNNILQLNEFYEESEKFYLVFNRLKGGSLFEQIQNRGHLSEMEASKIIRDLADALDFLHRKGIAHRDLKPENILCESPEKLTPVRICDFDLGNSVVLQREKSEAVTTPELMTPVGSAEYMAPEVVDAWVGDASSYDKKCDLWSLGIILYIMLSGYPPFYAKCGDECGWERGDNCDECQKLLFERIQEGQFSFPERDWAEISDSSKDLIRHLLQRDPRKRFSARQVLDHPWIRNPVPNTALQTPSILSRNNSSQMLLDAYAENAMAFNRLLVANLTISESTGSASSSEHSSHIEDNHSDDGGSNVDNGSAKFFIGGADDMSSDEDDVEGKMDVPLRKSGVVGPYIKLSPPSSSLAERRKNRYNSTGLSLPSTPSP